MHIGDLVKQYRVDHGLSMDEFARLSGLSKGYISMLEKNENPRTKKPIIPTVDTLQSISRVISVDINELVAVLDPEQEISLEHSVPSPNPPRFRRINVYGRVAAGVPIEAQEDILDWEDISFEDGYDPNKEYIGLMVKGDSMYPKYLDGDTIILEITSACESGTDAVVYVNGYDAALKRIIKNENGSVTLQPLNPNYPPKTYGKDGDSITILGIVKEIRRKV